LRIGRRPGFGPSVEFGVREVGVELLAAGERGRLEPAVVEVVGEPVEEPAVGLTAEMDDRCGALADPMRVSTSSISSSAR
jgi:hypothetical protein